MGRDIPGHICRSSPQRNYPELWNRTSRSKGYEKMKKPKPTSTQNLNLVADNPNCRNCIYRDKGSIFRWYCNYLEMEDKPRGCDVNGCTKKIEKVKKKATAGGPGWELTKEEQLALKRKKNKQFHTRRVFTHFCKDCGTFFQSYAPGTKWCEACKKKRQR